MVNKCNEYADSKKVSVQKYPPISVSFHSSRIVLKGYNSIGTASGSRLRICFYVTELVNDDGCGEGVFAQCMLWSKLSGSYLSGGSTLGSGNWLWAATDYVIICPIVFASTFICAFSEPQCNWSLTNCLERLLSVYTRHNRITWCNFSIFISDHQWCAQSNIHG